MNKCRRRIVEALEHYRCPECGCEANFEHHTVSVTTWSYSAKKARWTLAGCNPIENHGGTSEYIIDSCHQVRCRNCEAPIRWPDGTDVNITDDVGLDNWLELLADDWEQQKVERDKADAELDEAKQDIHPVGHLALLQARLNTLNTITGPKGLDPNDPEVQASLAESKAKLEAFKKEFED